MFTNWAVPQLRLLLADFPITTARVQSQVTPCGICDGLIGVWAGFFLAFYFPLPILIPQTCTTFIIASIIPRHTVLVLTVVLNNQLKSLKIELQLFLDSYNE
jgi:hypothetical protein